jgi:hypothetical protein
MVAEVVSAMLSPREEIEAGVQVLLPTLVSFPVQRFNTRLMEVVLVEKA